MIDCGNKAVAAADPFPQRVDEVVVQLQDRAAAVTDEMVVGIVDQLELTGAPAEIGLADQPQIAESSSVR